MTKTRKSKALKTRPRAMTDAEITAAAKSDPDNLPLTDTEFKRIAKLKRGGRPPMPERDRKVSVTLRLDPIVIDHYKSKGRGWQTDINNDLLSLAASRTKPKRQRQNRQGLPHCRTPLQAAARIIPGEH